MIDIAEHAGVDEALGGLRFVCVDLGELNVQLASGADGAVVHRLSVEIGACHRLFAVDVLSGFHRGYRNRRVPVVVQADVDQVDIRIGEHVADVRVSFLNVEPVGDVFQPVRQNFADGDDFGVRNLITIAGKMAFSDNAAADKSDSDFSHFITSFLFV